MSCPKRREKSVKETSSIFSRMEKQQTTPAADLEAAAPTPSLPAAFQPASPSRFFSSPPAAAGAHRRVAIAVDLSDESAYAVKWAVQNYLRPGDVVVLLHVSATSVLYGADWGAIDLSVAAAADAGDGDGAEAGSQELQAKREEDFDNFTATKAQDLAQPLVDAGIPYKIHIVKDHDMKERLCLEVERLGFGAMIMGSRGFGATRKGGKGRLGSVSDYCVHHCVCPVIVVRYPDDSSAFGDSASETVVVNPSEFHPVTDEPDKGK